jgi:hypothetical protein
MQSYREEAASRPVTQLDPLPAQLASSSGPDDMSKYRARYEEAMNPFEAFRGRVSNFVILVLLFGVHIIDHVGTGSNKGVSIT